MERLLRVRLVATWLLLLPLLVGCTDTATNSPRLLSTAELVCDSMISVPEAARSTEGYRWILDAAALPESHIRHETGRTDPETGLKFAKMGLLVKPGRAFTITVDPLQEADIRLLWGYTVGSEPPAERFVAPACEGDEEFHIYSGGVWVSEPVCARLTVSTQSGSESIVVPIDADCP